MSIFWEIHSNLPREAPGDAASTARAYRMLAGLPPQPRLLEVGCGPGSACFQLAQLSGGAVTAVDLHPPFLQEVTRRAAQMDLAARVTPVRMNMKALGFRAESFDVIWSEGAIYIAGFETGLGEWRRLLRPGGYLALTEATWLQASPPDEVRRFWGEAYPQMQDIPANLEAIRRQGYRVVGHFTLPESAWMEEYYGPMAKRIALLREKYHGQPDAQQQLDAEEVEIDIYRRYSNWYGYVFFVMQN